MAKISSFIGYLMSLAYEWAEKKMKMFYPGGVLEVKLLETSIIVNDFDGTDDFIASLFYKEGSPTILFQLWPGHQKLIFNIVTDYEQYYAEKPDVAEKLLENGVMCYLNLGREKKKSKGSSRTADSKHECSTSDFDKIASSYAEQGDYENALMYYSKALKMHEKVNGLRHPDSLLSLKNFIITLEKTINDLQAEQIKLLKIIGDLKNEGDIDSNPEYKAAMEDQRKIEELFSLFRFVKERYASIIDRLS